ncbi:PREDICTED: uncharacterized protein LOC109114993 [Nelumbo nucifera]|uniref:Uncharacterized protein LOC109114993 n=1 Tax=Nelumbo nucifera TaxID=4432 RepID=A0A1U8Q7S3_NELNU|nr:PREDICTED: uncharacterized protein LOC109114993 [Nelumbo nucifera]
MATDKETETKTEVVSDTKSDSDSNLPYNGVMDTDEELECIMEVACVVGEFYYDTWIHKEPKHTMDCIGAVYTKSLFEGHDGQLDFVYYVVDSMYPNIAGYMALYRNTQYFNNVHTSLRSVIVRSFGVYKARFPILKCMPCYPLRTQQLIVVAYMTIHNFIRDN